MHRANRHSTSINFHGVTVPGALPLIAESDVSWCVRVDIVDAPQLQLVLPARKEMVENAALLRLRRAARRAIYRHIETRGSHRLSFEHWTEAADLGLYPEARSELTEWAPATANIARYHQAPAHIDRRSPPRRRLRSSARTMRAFRAVPRRTLRGTARPLPDLKMKGYSWYDRLARITGMTFEIERAGETCLFDDTNLPGLESGLVDRLDLMLTFGPDAGKRRDPGAGGDRI